MKVLVVFGTRPEAIKLAPVIRELKKHSPLPASDRTVPNRQEIICKTCVSGQHREMLDQVLSLFDIVPDYDLNVMSNNQTPTQVASVILSRLEPVLKAERPDWVIVQGDTTTAAAASIAAFYSRSKVAHIEAGLRTDNKWEPFPEEINRRISSVVSDLHFAPTETSKNNLIRENIPSERIYITGNTVIDALLWVTGLPFDTGSIFADIKKRICEEERIILVTAHRRENLGQPLRNICAALKTLAAEYSGKARIVYPVHLNPNVRGPVYEMLGDVPEIVLLEPLDYLALAHLMKKSYIIITDSGGIQEEAPALGVPVLVMRDVTERPEGVAAGTVKLVGTTSEDIVKAAKELMEDTTLYVKMSQATNPYGDGHAAERIMKILKNN